MFFKWLVFATLFTQPTGQDAFWSFCVKRQKASPSEVIDMVSFCTACVHPFLVENGILFWVQSWYSSFSFLKLSFTFQLVTCFFDMETSHYPYLLWLRQGVAQVAPSAWSWGFDFGFELGRLESHCPCLCWVSMEWDWLKGVLKHLPRTWSILETIWNK